MEKELYLIRTYNMKDHTFRTYEKSAWTEEDINVTSGGRIFLKRGNLPSSYHLSFQKEGVEYDENGLLPYFATVIEDIPIHYNVQAKEYPNCQLMMEMKGGYKYFKNPENDEKLLIAMNSHTYNSKQIIKS